MTCAASSRRRHARQRVREVLEAQQPGVGGLAGGDVDEDAGQAQLGGGLVDLDDVAQPHLAAVGGAGAVLEVAAARCATTSTISALTRSRSSGWMISNQKCVSAVQRAGG